MRDYFVVKLLKDFIALQCQAVDSISKSKTFRAEKYDEIIFDAKGRCDDIELVWKDEYVPEHVRKELRLGEYGGN